MGMIKTVRRAARLMPIIGVALLHARAAWAAPTVKIVMPQANSFVYGDSNGELWVSAEISSPFVITSVTAQIGGTSKALSTSGASWSTAIPVAPIPFGPTTLAISASDITGDTATVSIPVTRDDPPQLTVATPDGAVAYPTIRLEASCTDTDIYGCASIAVEMCPSAACTWSPLASTTAATMDQVVGLPAGEIKLRFTATDTAGLKTVVTRTVIAETSPNLVAVDELSGTVLDLDATRILFAGTSGIAIKNRASGATAVVAPGTTSQGHLSSTGAIWQGGDFINGVFTARSGMGRFRARGDWAVWLSQNKVIRENLATGAVSTFTPDGTLVDQDDPMCDVDAAGNIVYSDYHQEGSFNIHAVSPDGVDTTLPLFNGWQPVVDGARVVWQKHALSSGRRAIEMYNGPQLDDYTSSYASARYFVDYRANDGWVAYTKLVGSGLTARTYSPTNVDALAGPSNSVKGIVAVNAAGEIVYDDGSWNISSAAAPAKALNIGLKRGKMVHAGGSWYKLLNNVVFRVDSSGGSDAGAGDGGIAADGGGADDGGTDSDAGVVTDSGALDDGGTDSDAGVDTDSGPLGDGSSTPGAGGGDASSDGTPGPGEPPDPPDEDDGGCSTAAPGVAAPTGAALATLALFASALARRRRRR